MSVNITPVHGPWTDDQLGANEKRKNIKNGLLGRIRQGGCECQLCADRDRTVTVPEPALWSRRPGEQGEVFLCQGPSMERAIGGQEPWGGRG